MQVDNLPAVLVPVQHDGSSVDESGPIIEMKCCNRQITEQLNLHFSWLNIHVWRCGPFAANLFEHRFEGFLKFSTPGCSLRKGTRIKDGGTIVEGQPKCL